MTSSGGTYIIDYFLKRN